MENQQDKDRKVYGIVIAEHLDEYLQFLFDSITFVNDEKNDEVKVTNFMDPDNIFDIKDYRDYRLKTYETKNDLLYSKELKQKFLGNKITEEDFNFLEHSFQKANYYKIGKPNKDSKYLIFIEPLNGDCEFHESDIFKFGLFIANLKKIDRINKYNTIYTVR